MSPHVAPAQANLNPELCFFCYQLQGPLRHVTHFRVCYSSSSKADLMLSTSDTTRQPVYVTGFGKTSHLRTKINI